MAENTYVEIMTDIIEMNLCIPLSPTPVLFIIPHLIKL